MIKSQTLKGFRDFLPKEERKRQYVINALKEVFELYGFEPLETPALEYEEVLLGKYGEEGDKLMYRFTDRGGRKVALRYDQTVPLARVVAQYGSTSSPQAISMPFKRYQIQPVWRAENPQKGRFREFLQVDADIVGSSSPLADAEIIAVAAKAIETLGFKKFKILINDKTVLFKFRVGMQIALDQGLNVVRALDKLKKIGREGVINEIISSGLSNQRANEIITTVERAKPNDALNQIFKNLEKLNIKYEFSPTLARGLDYYTGMIFEVEIEGYNGGSVAGGGRYDNLIELFASKKIPAVGFSFGFDRLIEAMDELKLFPKDITSLAIKVLVTVFNPELLPKSLEITLLLRRNRVTTELYLDENASLEKQLKYANNKGVPYVVIIGPEEAKKNRVVLRDMKNKTQKMVTQEELTSSFLLQFDL